MHKEHSQPGKLTYVLCPEFLLEVHHIGVTDWLIAHMVNLSLQVDWSKAPTLSHIIGLSGVVIPHP